MTGSATLTPSPSNSALEAQQMNTNHDIRRPGFPPLSATWPRWYRERRARWIRTGVLRPNVWTVYKSRLGWVALTPDGSCSMLRGYSTSDWAAVYRHANTEARKEVAACSAKPYTIQESHRDGRHASTVPEDRQHWIKSGCEDCARLLPGDRG